MKSVTNKLEDVRKQTEDEEPLEILVSDLYKSFGENEVLNGVNLNIAMGEIVAIVGASGCGKTVLLHHLFGELSPDNGQVLIADHDNLKQLTDINTLTEDGLDLIRTHWAVVFQRNALFSGTVYENIAVWLREIKGLSDAEISPIAHDAVIDVGLDPATTMEKDRDDLSGGMAKRVALARAIAMDPDLIFYDEPTTGLDPYYAAQIQDLILRIHREGNTEKQTRTTIIVTHDKDLLRRLRPRIVMIHEGIAYFDGTFDSFEQSDSKIIRPYLDLMPALQLRGRSTP